MINKNTTNKSFISAWHYLQDNGVENNSFMLELKNKKLIDFSYEKFMNEERTKEETIELREMILNEVKENIWFFFREIVRIPYSLDQFKSKNFDNSNLNGSVPFQLTEMSLCIIYLYSKGKDIFIKRQYANDQSNVIFKLLEIYEIITNSDYVIETYDIDPPTKEWYELSSLFNTILPIIQTPEDFEKWCNTDIRKIFVNDKRQNRIFFNIQKQKLEYDNLIYVILKNFLKIHKEKDRQIMMMLNYSDNENIKFLNNSNVYNLFNDIFLYKINYLEKEIFDKPLLNDFNVYTWW